MDYEFNPGEIVHVVNRTSEPVSFQFDGKGHTLKPHERRPMNLTYALYGIRRTPVMGTYNPAYEFQHDSLLGIEEMQDLYPITPIEQSNVLESIDRSKLPEDRQAAELVKVGWDDASRQAASRNPLSADAGFSGVMPDKA